MSQDEGVPIWFGQIRNNHNAKIKVNKEVEAMRNDPEWPPDFKDWEYDINNGGNIGYVKPSANVSDAEKKKQEQDLRKLLQKKGYTPKRRLQKRHLVHALAPDAPLANTRDSYYSWVKGGLKR